MYQELMEETIGSSSPRLEDLPELIHHIQWCLPLEDAARTSVLSKSWLRAWSTIPTPMFRLTPPSLSEQQKKDHLEAVDRTLTRYLHDNIPITMIHFMVDIQTKDSAEKLIQRLATTKSCLNNLSLSVFLRGTSFSLPDEILSRENLTKIRVSCTNYNSRHNRSLLMTTHPVINCVSLHKLSFECVHINDEVIHGILSTCSLLEVLELHRCHGFNTIIVKNLRRLRRLSVVNWDYQKNRLLEINDVPNLNFFRCQGIPLLFKTYSFGSVTQITLGNMIMDYTILDIITSKFPLLQILTLYMILWKLESFHIKCASMKRFSLRGCPRRLINVHVDAPKLIYFYFQGKTMPSLVFPAASIALVEKIKLVISLYHPVDASLFLNMRQALALSIKCDIEITAMINAVIVTPYIDILNLRKSVPSPAMNVQQLSFTTYGDDKGMWDHSPFFDAFFSICHPRQVVANPDKKFKHNNHFCQLMESNHEVMEKKRENLNWPSYLKVFETKPDEEEESHISVFKLQTELALT